ncbi:MAG: DUF4339 domain-containing protein [Hyphomicrobium sp.]
MNGQSDETQWYIARDGKQHGPLTDIEMRTFVAHNYLRATDLIWKPGLPEWQAAPEVFPAVFAPAAKAAQQAASASQQTSYGAPSANPTAQAYPATPVVDAYAPQGQAQPAAPAVNARKRLAIAAAAVALIGGGAFALTSYREPLTRMVGGEEKTVEIAATASPASEPPVVKADTAPPAADASAPAPTAETPTDAVQTAATQPDTTAPAAGDAATAGSASTNLQTAALPPDAPAAAPAAEPPPLSIEGSAIDAKLRKIPAWSLIKQDYPDWYVGHIAAADKLAAEKKPESEIAMHLAQGLVALRRQNAEKALAASPEKLRKIATAFLDNLKSLRTQSVSACYGFISKGEVSPAVVQLMETPESATALNTQVAAVFEAIAEGSKTPVKHEPAVKADYDILIKELGKLGWKEEDLQVFSNPRLLAKREPDRVCKMVQDWFVAHLAVPDKPARDRLLYETLKPVVSG